MDMNGFYAEGNEEDCVVSLTPALHTHISLSLSLSFSGWTYTRGRACVGH